MSPILKLVFKNGDDIIEIITDVVPAIDAALRRSSPGGKKITRAEFDDILNTIGRAIAEQFEVEDEDENV